MYCYSVNVLHMSADPDTGIFPAFPGLHWTDEDDTIQNNENISVTNNHDHANHHETARRTKKDENAPSSHYKSNTNNKSPSKHNLDAARRALKDSDDAEEKMDSSETRSLLVKTKSASAAIDDPRDGVVASKSISGGVFLSFFIFLSYCVFPALRCRQPQIRRRNSIESLHEPTSVHHQQGPKHWSQHPKQSAPYLHLCCAWPHPSIIPAPVDPWKLAGAAL